MNRLPYLIEHVKGVVMLIKDFILTKNVPLSKDGGSVVPFGCHRRPKFGKIEMTLFLT